MNVVYTIKESVISANNPGTSSQAFRFDEDEGGGRRIDMMLRWSIDLAILLITEESGREGRKKGLRKVICRAGIHLLVLPKLMVAEEKI